MVRRLLAGSQLGPIDAERRQSLGLLYTWSLEFFRAPRMSSFIGIINFLFHLNTWITEIRDNLRFCFTGIINSLFYLNTWIKEIRDNLRFISVLYRFSIMSYKYEMIIFGMLRTQIWYSKTPSYALHNCAHFFLFQLPCNVYYCGINCKCTRIISTPYINNIRTIETSQNIL